MGTPNDLDHYSFMSTAGPIEKSKSVLANLITCVACNLQMKIERSDPDKKGRAMIQYRCGSCGDIVQLRLSPLRGAP
jgi:transcription elongation factor Elf1